MMLDEIMAILLRPVTNQLEEIMATAEELRDSVNSLSAAIDAAKTRITDDVNNLRSEISALEARVVELGGQAAELDAVKESVDTLATNVAAIDPDPNNPPPAPPAG